MKIVHLLFCCSLVFCNTEKLYERLRKMRENRTDMYNKSGLKIASTQPSVDSQISVANSSDSLPKLIALENNINGMITHKVDEKSFSQLNQLWQGLRADTEKMSLNQSNYFGNQLQVLHKIDNSTEEFINTALEEFGKEFRSRNITSFVNELHVLHRIDNYTEEFIKMAMEKFGKEIRYQNITLYQRHALDFDVYALMDYYTSKMHSTKELLLGLMLSITALLTLIILLMVISCMKKYQPVSNRDMHEACIEP